MWIFEAAPFLVAAGLELFSPSLEDLQDSIAEPQVQLGLKTRAHREEIGKALQEVVRPRSRFGADAAHLVYVMAGALTAYCFVRWNDGPPRADIFILVIALVVAVLLFIELGVSQAKAANYANPKILGLRWVPLTAVCVNVVLFIAVGVANDVWPEPGAAPCTSPAHVATLGNTLHAHPPAGGLDDNPPPPVRP